MIVTTKELFKAAYGKYAIGAYNINNLEQTMGLFRGNLDSRLPSSSRSAKAHAPIPTSSCSKASSAQLTRSSRKPFSPSTSTTAMKKPATTASTAVSTPR